MTTARHSLRRVGGESRDVGQGDHHLANLGVGEVEHLVEASFPRASSMIPVSSASARIPRSSSWLRTASRAEIGRSPSGHKSAVADPCNGHTTGCAARPSSASGRATAAAARSARSSAIALGTSSPSTNAALHPTSTRTEKTRRSAVDTVRWSRLAAADTSRALLKADAARAAQVLGSSKPSGRSRALADVYALAGRAIRCGLSGNAPEFEIGEFRDGSCDRTAFGYKRVSA